MVAGAARGTSGPPGIRQVGRRTVLGGTALSALAALAGCTGEESAAPNRSASATRSAAPTTAADKALVWVNWPGYMDYTEDRSKSPTLDAFTSKTGIEVDYREDIDDNVEYVESIEAALVGKRPVQADILTLTTWMAAKLARQGLFRPFGPVDGATVIPALARPEWDPDQKLSIPWQAGLTGIAYDARRVERAITSVGEIFTRSDLKGRLGILSEYDDAIGMTLLGQGKDAATATPGDVEAAIGFLGDEKKRGQIQGFYGNDFVDELTSGRLVASIAWSGDVLQAQADNPYLKFVVPEEGLMIWADNLLVPVASTRSTLVTQLVEYYYQPQVAAKLAAWVNYICPVEGARDAMQEIDPDLANSPLIFPDSTVLDRAYQLPAAAGSDELRAAFAKVAG
ncbi:MAG: polyamine ABC transporter substrate-binding protein [Dermatophilaceae bacterium]